jgi:hypothetical protein
MKKTMKKLTVLTTIMAALTALAACSNPVGGGDQPGGGSPVTYTVAFNSDGGSQVESQNVEAGARSRRPPPPHAAATCSTAGIKTLGLPPNGALTWTR